MPRTRLKVAGTGAMVVDQGDREGSRQRRMAENFHDADRFDAGVGSAGFGPGVAAIQADSADRVDGRSLFSELSPDELRREAFAALRDRQRYTAEEAWLFGLADPHPAEPPTESLRRQPSGRHRRRTTATGVTLRAAAAAAAVLAAGVAITVLVTKATDGPVTRPGVSTTTASATAGRITTGPITTGPTTSGPAATTPAATTTSPAPQQGQ